MDNVTFVKEECARDGAPDATQQLLEAINFLSSISFAQADEMEVEMYIMHAAYIVDSRNAFTDNYNVTNKNVFIDHVAMLKSSDVAAWSKRLADYSLWTVGNRRIANLVYNWISGTLDQPTRVVS
jgi:hypothetical protein